MEISVIRSTILNCSERDEKVVFCGNFYAFLKKVYNVSICENI